MLQHLLDIALDLTTRLPAADRHRRLVASVRRVVPCDAAAIFAWRDGALVPLAAEGLAPAALGVRLDPKEHPRLQALLEATAPVRFAADDPRPDPFDGLVDGAPPGALRVHACMGSALRVDGELVGAFTVDALSASAFDDVDDTTFATFSALAAAALRTGALLDALAEAASHEEEVARQLVREALTRDGGALVGQSKAACDLRKQIDLVAGSDVPVLVTGETGVGKELVARMLHARSRRADQTIVYVNCAALPESIAESELFGHRRGAFTGAISDRKGRFELAHRGTLFLDEVGEMPLGVQAKLLRALQFGEIQRVGDDAERRVDVRILAATNRDLKAEVQAGRFRADLFHRLSVFPIHVPPLRERERDVELLAGLFLDGARSRLGIAPLRLTPQARAALAAYDWPGNVRELEHVMLRAALTVRSDPARPAVVDVPHLCLPHSALGVPAQLPAAMSPAPVPSPRTHFPPLPDAVDAFQRSLVEEAVAAAGGSLSGAARLLAVDRSNLHRLARRLGLNPSSTHPA